MQRDRPHCDKGDCGKLSGPSKYSRGLVGYNSNMAHELQLTVSPLGKQVRSIPPPPVVSIKASATKLTELERKKRRREQCRVNQAHYRTRKRRVVMCLQLNNHLLEKEIQDLELHRQSYFLGIPAKQTPWTFATRYFALFRESMLRSHRFDTLALRSLLASTTSDVTDGFVVGPQALLENLKLFSRYFSNFDVVLEELKKGPTIDSVIAITTTSVTLSEDTLRLVFPHLNKDGQQSLRSKLLHQQLVMRGSVQFDWEQATNRVVGIHSRSDMLTPMLQTLGSLTDVSRVFGGALVTPECRLQAGEK